MKTNDCDSRIRSNLAGINRFRRKKDGIVAHHKPLLLMFMLGHYWNNGGRMVLFRDVMMPMWYLLNEYGNGKFRPGQTLYPFVSLEQDEDIWETTPVKLETVDYNKAFTMEYYGGFVEELYNRIINDKVFILDLAFHVYKTHLMKRCDRPLADLLLDVGIPARRPESKAVLAPDLAGARPVSKTSSCAVCSYRGDIFNNPVGLRNAFVKWPVAGGPTDTPNNRLIMCDLHKTLFDCGLFTVDPKRYVLKVSKDTRKIATSDEVPLSDGQEIRGASRIDARFVDWHNEFVFGQKR